MFEVGDEVLIKGKIAAFDLGKSGNPYWVGVSNGMGYWLSEWDITDKTYEQGLADAWELAKKLADMKHEDFKEIFDKNGLYTVIFNYSYEEALAKIEAYEKEIKVRDVVKVICGNTKGVVTRIDSEGCYVMWSDGVCGNYTKSHLEKTGETAECLDDLLRQIGE